tara:strand:+ start:555 stop:764 length:210 start_codon:yes stop_codon:yes gene_type:complete
MNREDNSNPTTQVRKGCANYNTNYKCSGVMINKDLRQCIDAKLCGKVCLIKEGEDCDYFTNIVKPSIKE